MHWILAAIIANLAIFALEYIYRTTRGNFFSVLYLTTIPIVLAQWALFDMFKNAPSLLIAGAAFTIVNAVLRMVNSYLVGEPPGLWAYFGVLLMVVAVFIIKRDV